MSIEKATKEEVMLEYRIAVLEGITDWMLSNGVFMKSIEDDEMKQIHTDALYITRRRYPGIEIEFKGRWQR